MSNAKRPFSYIKSTFFCEKAEKHVPHQQNCYQRSLCALKDMGIAFDSAGKAQYKHHNTSIQHISMKYVL